MSNIEKAIERMQKVESACDKLLLIALRDVDELKARKKRAAQIIKGFEGLSGKKYDHLLENTAAEIVCRDLSPVSCMGVAIRV